MELMHLSVTAVDYCYHYIIELRQALDIIFDQQVDSKLELNIEL